MGSDGLGRRARCLCRGRSWPVAVGGDSAGGNLAAAVTFRARALGLSLAFQLLVYPVTDADLDTASYLENATGYGLSRDAMRWYWEQYLGPDGDAADPEAAPLRVGNLADLRLRS